MSDQTTTPDWATLPLPDRARLLQAGIGHPGETADERRARLKNTLGLADDGDLAALMGVTLEVVQRHRGEGKGPTPIRISRETFYRMQDVADWIARQRDGKTLKGHRAA